MAHSMSSTRAPLKSFRVQSQIPGEDPRLAPGTRKVRDMIATFLPPIAVGLIQAIPQRGYG